MHNIKATAAAATAATCPMLWTKRHSMINVAALCKHSGRERERERGALLIKAVVQAAAGTQHGVVFAWQLVDGIIGLL